MTTLRNSFAELNRWYSINCDGVWEHDWRIKIETIDNPGWSLKINHRNCRQSIRPFPKEAEENYGDDWIFYGEGEKNFFAYGSPDMIDRMIEIFLNNIEW